MKSFKVFGMSCAACSARVERAVSALPSVESCSVNLLLGTMTVLGGASSEEIIDAVRAAGYRAEKKDNSQENVNNTVQNSKKRITARLISSAVLLLILMYLSMGHVMLGAPVFPPLSGNALLIAAVECALSLSVLIINGRFFINGAKGAIHLAPNMDTLVALGAGASFIFSAIQTIRMVYSPESMRAEYLHGLYFESAAMIVTLITVGKLLEAGAKHKTTDAVRSLISLAPRTALVEREGKEESIPISELREGDIFILKPGALVPCDGVVLEGESQISEAALTGEFMPKDKTVGDAVLCATANGRGYLRCRAEKVGEDTAISAVIRLCEEAASTKAPIARIADKVAGIFVPAVLLISLLTLGIWLLVGAKLGYALGRCISVLVISCPCALGLATPVAITVGSGIAARRGILFKSAQALENLGRTKTVAIDKTGTVTVGEPQVSDVVCFSATKDELISAAYTAEAKSEHPIARAVCALAQNRGAELLPSEGFSATPGAGVRCIASGEEILAVSHGFAKGQRLLSNDAEREYSRLSAEGKTVIFIARGGVLLGLIAISDKMRDEAPSAMDELSKMGVSVVMLTGDNERCARAVAESAGIREVRSELLPDGKAAAIRELTANGKVAMVGDGINDAPSLAAADVGIAVGTGTDIAIEAADAVIMQSKLSLLPEALKISRAVLGNIKENLFWAFIYNIIGIPLAAGAFAHLLGWEMSPMIGALAMSLSSFSVVMNALRLNFKFRMQKSECKEESEDGCTQSSECQIGSTNPCTQSSECQIGVANPHAPSSECQSGSANPHAPSSECQTDVAVKASEPLGTERPNAVLSENEKAEDEKTEEIKTEKEKNMSFTLNVEGMMCPHCEARVKATVEGVCGVISAKVSHKDGTAIVEADKDCKEAVAEAIRAAGYAVK